MELIDNGMYVLTLIEGKDTVVDGTGYDYDNEILGAMSVDGMPLSRDVRMNGTEVIKEDTHCAGVDGKFDDYFPENTDIDLSETSTWDPFGGVVAPKEFVYISELAFIFFGTTSKNSFQGH
jgi:hypothetical protein